ncbi:MAG: response regulator [Dissulfurispiraceae bacterium]
MGNPTKQLRVLIADNDISTRRMIISCLKPNHVEVEEATSGLEAQEMLKKCQYDLVLSEWEIPGMTGYALLRWVRSRPETKDTPFIVITQPKDKTNIIQAIKEGVSGYVIKPFTKDTFIKALLNVDPRFGENDQKTPVHTSRQPNINHSEINRPPTVSSDLQQIDNAEHLIQSVGIPSQPAAILELNKEMGKAQLDLQRVAGLISKDVSMSAKVIKIAASPFFGSKRVDSIEQALILLGVKNFQKLILSASLRDSFDGYGVPDSARH